MSQYFSCTSIRTACFTLGLYDCLGEGGECREGEDGEGEGEEEVEERRWGSGSEEEGYG